MPHYVLHIGPHKTATSYLQNGFAANQAALEAAGIHLARLWNDSPQKPSHTGLVQRLNSERRRELEAVFAGWRASDHATVLISCEDLASLCREPFKLRMLRELTAGSPVTIVYYVRRWSDLLASEWQEYVKQGSTLRFPEVAVHNLRDPANSHIINIDLCLGVFAEMFGKSSIRVVSYDGVIASGQNILAHFSAHFLGEIDLRPPARGIANASLPPAGVELLRLFNCLDRETGTSSGILLRFFNLQHLPAPMTQLLAHLETHQTTMTLTDNDSAVRDLLIQNRADYAACALPPVETHRFHAEKTVELSYINPDYALTPGFAETVPKLHGHLSAISNPRA